MSSIYYSDFTGNAQNCIYSHRAVITNEEELRSATRHDFVCAEYKGGYRSNYNFIKSDMLVMDCDNDHSEDDAEWVTAVDVAEAFPDVEFFVHYSRNNNRKKGGASARPRFHILFPIDETTDREEYSRLKKRVLELFPYFDRNALDASRFIYGTENPEVEMYGGSRNLSVFLAEAEAEDAFALLDEQKKVIAEGSRNNTMSSMAGRLLKRYGDTEKAHGVFMEYAAKCDPPLPDEELSKIWTSAQKFYQKISSQPGYIPPEEYEKTHSLEPADYTDIGQAEVLTREYGHELAFTRASDYMRFDGVRWVEAKEMAIGACEELTGRQLEESEKLYSDARDALEKAGIPRNIIEKGGAKLESEIHTEAQAKAFIAYLDARGYYMFTIKRRDAKYVSAAVQLAKPMVFRDINEFDADGFLINTPCGTYDLRYGTERMHDHTADDLMTKVTAVSPSDEGKELWLDAIGQFFCHDSELISYVQKIVGLSIIGKVFMESLIISYGDGRNGKSTFWNTIYKVLGGYGGTMSADALTVGCRRNVKPEKAELKGKRLIIAAELEEGTRLSTSMVKQLCSTDDISAEKKYKDHFSFTPTHTLVLYTNHLPRIGATDAGIWRRLVVIPFNAVIEGSSDIKNYADYLAEKAGGAVLAWAMEGARMVIGEGYRLEMPECVKEAIGTYKDDNDWLSDFINEKCEVSREFIQKSGEFYQEYRLYCQKNGEFTRSTTDFYAALNKAGFARKRTKTGSFLYGIRLKDEFLES